MEQICQWMQFRSLLFNPSFKSNLGVGGSQKAWGKKFILCQRGHSLRPHTVLHLHAAQASQLPLNFPLQNATLGLPVPGSYSLSGLPRREINQDWEVTKGTQMQKGGSHRTILKCLRKWWDRTRVYRWQDTWRMPHANTCKVSQAFFPFWFLFFRSKNDTCKPKGRRKN